VLVAEKMKLM
jgi:hypothetical protein